MKLSGNTILITGGSSGIGLALAKQFVGLGNDVIITGRSQDKLDAAKRQEPKLRTYRGDAGDPKAVAELAKEMKTKHPGLNVLINNAGIMVYRNMAKPATDLAALTSEIETNLCGPVRMVSAMIEQLKANKGTIINVSSGLAFVPLTAAPVYCATKAAIHSFSITLRQQLRDHGVEVIEIAPPAVKTDLVHLPEDPSFKVISTEELVTAVIRGLKKGSVEIAPGQSGQLRLMSRVAPGFIQGQLEKGSRKLIPSA